MFGLKRLRRTSVIVHIVLLLTSQSATQDSDSDDSLYPKLGLFSRVSAIVGGEVLLPCNVQPPINNDSLLLVVWYRDDKPVYSYDTRMDGLTSHWAEDIYKDRTQWLNTPNSGLQFQNIQPRDRAVYRCRVDYLISPTRNYKVALDVIELPSKPVIFDEYSKEVHGIAGPYREGDEFKLICTVHGGVPTPRLQWQQDDNILTILASGDLQPSGVVRSLVLTIRNATSAHLSSVFTCIADNTVLSPAQKISVRVDLFLKPKVVEIVSKELPLSVGRKTDLLCRSSGAKPPANITWWLGGTKLDSVSQVVGVKDGNETQSLLRWTPQKEHNGRVLTCRADHYQFSSARIESKLPLNVYYVPEAKINFGANINPNDIEEGDDVYFSCDVDENPPSYKVVWEHNGVQLQNNPSIGVIVTGNINLALRNVTKLQAGEYTCTASNVEGDGRSAPLIMHIVYRPICATREIKLIGAALQEQTPITCKVEAFPPPDNFEWTLNNSVGSIKVDPNRFTFEAQDRISVLSYTPVSDIDYGTLSCRAFNMAGQQVSPCLYSLMPATRPDPPANCTVYNLTHDSLDLLCMPGYEGGLQCVYIVEVWANDGLVVNATNGVASWNLRRLGPNRQIRLIVYAANARGRSEHVLITVETAFVLSPRTEAQESWELNWAIGIVLGAAVTVALILCLAFLVTRMRHRSRDYEVTLPTLKNQKVVVPKRNSLNGQDERNPDLIPLSKDVTECPPKPPSYSAVVATSALGKNSASSQVLPRSHTPITPITHGLYTEAQNELRIGSNAVVRHREIVTTRTPLLSAHQESCV